MIDDIFLLLDKEYAEWPVLRAGPVSTADVEELERAAGMALPEEYKAFVRRYGAGIVGAYTVLGVGASRMMADDESSAVEMTRRFREDGWPLPLACLVISTDHGGNPLYIEPGGTVRIFDHDFGGDQDLAPSFEQFLRDRLAEVSGD